MKIIRFEAENIKRLVAVEIEPSGNVIKITGENGAGKTSVLDAIWWALAGADNIQKKPIRDGAKHGTITLALGPDEDGGELIVKRRFSAGGNTYLSVEKGKGFKAPSPQKMLDALIGALTFDPLEFMRMAPRDQAEVLRDLSGLDTSSIDSDRALHYEARREVARELKSAAGALSLLPVVDLEDGAALKNSSTIIEQLDTASAMAVELIAAQDAVIDGENDVEEAEKMIEECQRNVVQARKNKARVALTLKALKSDAEAVPEPPDMEALRKELVGVDEHNEKVRSVKRRSEATVLVEDLNAKVTASTALIKECDDEKAKMTAAVTMPLDGLSFDGDGTVIYGGNPLDQASQAEQLRVSMAIAMSTNPTLRVIRITDGSLLDSASLAIIEELATDNDFQVWLEMVDESGEVGVVIEDGCVKGASADAIEAGEEAGR